MMSAVSSFMMSAHCDQVSPSSVAGRCHVYGVHTGRDAVLSVSLTLDMSYSIIKWSLLAPNLLWNKYIFFRQNKI